MNPKKNPKIFSAIVSVVFTFLVLLVAPIMAANAHFINANASVNNSGVLVASFKEAGLGNDTQTATITLSAFVSTTWGCFNNGGKHPQAANKETQSGNASTSGSFDVRNGQTTGTLTLGPIGPGSFSCPNGQRLRLMSVSYTNVMLQNAEFNDVANIPGTFSRTFIEG